jgi:hypothetical protein
MNEVDLSKDALHIFIGLAVMLGFALLTGVSLRSWRPWLAVLAATVLGEILDLWDYLPAAALWRWMSSLHDLVVTLFWPTILMILARTGWLGRR